MNITQKTVIATIRLFKWAKNNKTLLTIVIGGIYLTFIDDNGFWVQAQLRKQAKEMKTKKEKISKDLNDAKTELHLFETDTAYLETFARENYFLKRDNETIYYFNNQ